MLTQNVRSDVLLEIKIVKINGGVPKGKTKRLFEETSDPRWTNRIIWWSQVLRSSISKGKYTRSSASMRRQ